LKLDGLQARGHLSPKLVHGIPALIRHPLLGKFRILPGKADRESDQDNSRDENSRKEKEDLSLAPQIAWFHRSILDRNLGPGCHENVMAISGVLHLRVARI
jgi:hypothetical protein